MIWKYFIPNIIFDNPFLYNLYFHLIRKHRGIVPDYFTYDTDYYFDGYPRSGNTYLAHLVTNIFPSKKSVHHLHRIGPIKIALRKDIITFILIRDPMDSISSNYLKYFAERKQEFPEKIDQKLLKYMTKEYMKYYQFVSSQKNSIHLIHFDDLINNPSKVVYGFSKLFGSGYDFEYIKTLVDKFEKSYVGATSKYGSSTPSKAKEIKKDQIKNELESLALTKKCKNIYGQLLEN